MKPEFTNPDNFLVKDLRLIGLPSEILFHIFSYLASSKDLVALSKTSKTTRKIAFDFRLWEPFQKDRFIYSRKVNLSEPLTSRVQIILPNGCMISGNEDYVYDCRVWDLETGNCIKKLDGHKSKITALASSNDSIVVSGDATGVMRIWDTVTWQCINVIKDKDNCSIDHLVIFPNGNIISGNQSGTLRFWKVLKSNVKSRKYIQKNGMKHYKQGLISILTTLSNDKLAVCYTDNRNTKGSGDILILDLKQWKVILRLRDRRHSFGFSLLKSIGDNYLISGSDSWSDNICRLWNTNTGKCLYKIKLGSFLLSALAILPEGHIVGALIKFRSTSKIIIWKQLTGELVNEIKLDLEILNLATLTNGRLIIVGKKHNTVRILTYPSLLPENLLKQQTDENSQQYQTCGI